MYPAGKQPNETGIAATKVPGMQPQSGLNASGDIWNGEFEEWKTRRPPENSVGTVGFMDN